MVVESTDKISNTSQSLPLVKEWLNACQSLHPKCNNLRQRFIPTRLIDLHGSIARLRLISSFEDEVVQYATLSHCWGTSEKGILKLTRSTLENYLSEIKTRELPKTFRDAIEICQRLNIRYLWIDSLCIIQDDEEDWAKESVTMADVYGGCLLNIAASSARDSSQGCFFKRKDLPRCNVSLKIDNNTNAEYNFVALNPDPRRHKDLCPLESRGWTLQERLLSPRTVHFTRKEVFWECRTKLASETLPFDANEGLREAKEPLSIKNWDNITSQYSIRRFTYEKDRLIALSGIAQTIWSQTKDGYCAGIWYDNLGELFWRTFDDEPPEKVFPKRAPTWSWASINSPCFSAHGYKTGVKKVSKVLKLERPRSDNPFGDMPNAVLWLSCPPLLVAKVTERNRLTMRNGFAITSDCFSFYPSHIVDDETCVFILRLMNRGGLILMRTEDSQGEYERIGAWGHYPTFPDITTFFKQVCNDRTNHAEESAYVPRERHEIDDEQHVITLV